MSSSNTPRGSLQLPQAPSPTPSQSSLTSRGMFKFWKKKRLPGFCEDCSNINFDQFAGLPATSQSGPANITMTLLSLFDIIKNKRSDRCKFCTLLFEALALPRHDPFQHPAIKDHMPPKVKQKTFQEWAEQISWHDAILKSPHPFGASRNKVQIKQEGNEIQEVRREDLEAAQQAGLVASASASGATLQAASQEKNKDGQTVLLVVGNAGSLLTSAFAMMNHKMPAVVTIKVHNATDPDAGLLEVTMSGYGHKVQAALSILSRFNLRVSSSYVAHEDGPSLQYGNIIDDKINVEGHCQPLLNHCRNRHKKLCEKPTWFTKLRPPMGEHFRLIDVKKRTVVQMNVNKNGIFSPQTMLPKYAALSYVWGKTGKKALRLHLDNASRLADGIDKVSDEDNIKVARTILDAIDVTRRLGIPYLWADSLCVIQEDLDDDQELPEISSQLGQMDSIFGHASIVIVAAAGTHAEAGLPGITSSREPGQIALKVRDDVNVLLAVQYGDSYGKWDTRAWTLQEKLLSRRMLVFDGNYVSFHCRHGILREDMPAIHAGNGPPRIPYLSMPPDSDAPRVRRNWDGTPVFLRSPFFSEYAKLLEQYTSRNLTKPGDILNGMLGLLKVLEGMRNSGRSYDSPDSSGVQVQLGDHTLYGLPEEFIDLALLWQPPAVIEVKLTQRTNDRFPSWSWAGWESGKYSADDQDADDQDADDQDADEQNQFRPGVRFEEPFWVSGNDDMSLKKFAATGNNAEERFRPLVMWYKWQQDHYPESSSSTSKRPEDSSRPAKKPKPAALRSNATKAQSLTVSQPTGKLVPVNGNGVGIQCGSETDLKQFKDDLIVFRTNQKPPNDPGPPFVEPGIPLSDRHLICHTQVAKFSLRLKRHSRTETLWGKANGEALTSERTFEIVEAEILDSSKNVVGYAIPTDRKQSIMPDHLYQLVLLSESQYWGNEERIDVVDYPLFNVMVVKWDTREEFATRLGLGKISKSAWKDAKPFTRRVILK